MYLNSHHPLNNNNMDKISAHELRIGNLVWRVFAPYGNERDRWYETITKLSVDNDLSLPSSHIEPIKLTPELLERCGFVKDGFNSHSISINSFPFGLNALYFSGDYLYIRQGVDSQPSSADELCTLWNKDIKKEFYLHELQNLYYALTNIELDVKM